MNQQTILTAFLEEAFQKEQLTLDEQTIAQINAAVSLAKAEGKLSEEQRTVELQQDSTGKISASSFKLYNIAQISLYDLLGFLGKETGIILFDDTAKKIVYGLIMLLHEFYPKLKVDFNEQEAKVLFCIAQLKKKNFSTSELSETFDQLFETKLPEEKLEASLEVLVKHKVLKRTAAKKYQAREKIKNLSRAE